jgi:hypothetical protein
MALRFVLSGIPVSLKLRQQDGQEAAFATNTRETALGGVRFRGTCAIVSGR